LEGLGSSLASLDGGTSKKCVRDEAFDSLSSCGAVLHTFNLGLSTVSEGKVVGLGKVND